MSRMIDRLNIGCACVRVTRRTVNDFKKFHRKYRAIMDVYNTIIIQVRGAIEWLNVCREIVKRLT